jgi:hypothetical protein
MQQKQRGGTASATASTEAQDREPGLKAEASLPLKTPTGQDLLYTAPTEATKVSLTLQEQPAETAKLEDFKVSQGANEANDLAPPPLLLKSDNGGARLPKGLAEKAKVPRDGGAPEQRRRHHRRKLNSTIRGNYDSDDSVYDYDSDFIDDSDITEDYAATGKPGFGVLSGLLGPRWNRDQTYSVTDASALSTPPGGQVAGGQLDNIKTKGDNDDSDNDLDEWDWSRRQLRTLLPAPVEEAAHRLEERVRDLFGERKPNGWEKIPELAELYATLCEQAVATRWATLPTSDEPMLYSFREELLYRLSFLRTTRPKLLQVASARYWRQIEQETEGRLRDLWGQLQSIVERETATEETVTSTPFWTPSLIDCVHQYFLTQIQALTAANFRYKKPRSVSKMLKVFATDLKQHPVFVSQTGVTAKDLESVYRKREAELIAERRARREEERQRKREEKQRAKEQQLALSADGDDSRTPAPTASQMSGSVPRSPYACHQSSTSPASDKHFLEKSPRPEHSQKTQLPENQEPAAAAAASVAGVTASAEKRRARSLEERFAELQQWRQETNEWSATHPYPSVISQKDGFRSVRLWVKAQRMAARGTGRGKLAPEAFFRRCMEELHIDLLYGIDAPSAVGALVMEETPQDASNRAPNLVATTLKMPPKSRLEPEIFAPLERFRIPNDLAEEAAREAAAAAAAAPLLTMRTPSQSFSKMLEPAVDPEPSDSNENKPQPERSRQTPTH